MTEDVDLYRWLVDHIEHFHTNIALVVSKLLSGKPQTNPIIDGSTQKEVKVLKSSNTNIKVDERNLKMYVFTGWYS